MSFFVIKGYFFHSRNIKYGYCKASNEIKIALASLHYDEEPCISGENGSGTIFFSNCNLKCVYCQNHKISFEGFGKEISIEHLAEIMLSQQKNGANNINLVTPTIYVLQIIEAIKIARQKGLNKPIIYNSSGYESINTLKLLDGYIDVYLPDFKYFDNNLAIKYSKIKDYAEITKNAIKEMYRQVETPILDRNGLIQKGLVIRHMVLPNNISNSKNILRWVKDNFDNKVFISVMFQYFPTHLSNKYSEINRKVNNIEYEEILNYIYDLELYNGYVQELEDDEEKFVPNFDLSE